MAAPVVGPKRLELERRLARRAVEGDQAAFVALFEAHHREVHRIGRAVTGDDEAAKDVVQETFLKVYRGLPRWRGASSLRTWIFRIAVRSAIDQRRWASRHVATLESEREPYHDPRASMNDALAMQRVRELAERLEGQQGLILRLRLLGDLSNAEIAEALGLSPANVRMQTTKALRRLKELL
jgi:RNA polymerase sigma-70 factor (ECF subfamily)